MLVALSSDDYETKADDVASAMPYFFKYSSHRCARREHTFHRRDESVTHASIIRLVMIISVVVWAFVKTGSTRKRRLASSSSSPTLAMHAMRGGDADVNVDEQIVTVMTQVRLAPCETAKGSVLDVCRDVNDPLACEHMNADGTTIACTIPPALRTPSRVCRMR